MSLVVLLWAASPIYALYMFRLQGHVAIHIIHRVAKLQWIGIGWKWNVVQQFLRIGVPQGPPPWLPQSE